MLFISHSTLDKAAALELQQRLRDRGYACEQHFLDSDQRSGIKLGEKWEKVIYDNLQDCRALIVLCSPNWLQSKWCFAELASAKMTGKQIFPVVIQDCDRGALDEYQAVFVNQEKAEDREQSFNRLFQDLEARGLGPKDHLPWPNPELKDAAGRVDACPFPGLPAFDERYAAVYFGRERETQVVLEELRQMRSTGEPRLLMIVGGSGSGKSSLLMAGVLPRLKHATSHSEWLVLPTLRFGRRDYHNALFETLADAIVARYSAGALARGVVVPDRKTLRDQFGVEDAAQSAKSFLDTVRDLAFACGCQDATVLLPIDQFEEFLASSAGARATKFLKFLEQLCRHRNDRMLVMGTMRSDYLDIYERHPHALKAPKFHPWRLEPFPREQIENVIVKPAERVHVEVADDLLEQLKQETPTTDALPLLAFMLEKLYRTHAGDKKLELREYNSLGGMEGSIKQTAEKIMLANSLPPAVESAVRLSFVKHLAQVNDNGAQGNDNVEFVRLTARWKDLDPIAYPILESFVAQRLLTKTERDGAVSIEVAHEAMFRCWEQLNTWLRTSVDILRWRRDVRRSQETAQANKQKWTGLTGPQRAIARDWLKKRREELSSDEIDWIKAANLRSQIWTIAASAVALVIATLAGVSMFLNFYAGKQKSLAAAADARALNAQGTADLNAGIESLRPVADSLKAVLHFRKAERSFSRAGHSPLSRIARFAGDENAAIIRHSLPLDGSVVGIWMPSMTATNITVWSQDGETHRVASWNWQTDDIPKVLTLNSRVNRAWSSQDGLRCITDEGAGGIKFRKMSDGEEYSPALKQADSSFEESWHSTWVLDDLNRGVALSHAGTIKRWPEDASASSRIDIKEQMVFSHSDQPLVLSYPRRNIDPDRGPQDVTAILWDVDSGQRVTEIPRLVGAVFDRQGRRRVLSWNSSGSASIWSVGSSDPVTLAHDMPVSGGLFSEDGTTVITWSSAKDSSVVRFWNASMASPVDEPFATRLAGKIDRVVVSPSGSRCVVSATQIREKASENYTFILNRDSAIKPIRIWPSSAVGGSCFLGNDSLVATWSNDGGTEIDVWDLTLNSSEIRTPKRVLKHQKVSKTYRPAFANAVAPRSGDDLITWGSDGVVHVWRPNASDGKLLAFDAAPEAFQRRFNIPVFQCSFSRSNSYAVGWCEHDGVWVWRVADTNFLPMSILDKANIKEIVFSDDEKAIVVWHASGKAMAYSLEGTPGRELLPPRPNANALIGFNDGWAVVRTGEKELSVLSTQTAKPKCVIPLDEQNGEGPDPIGAMVNLDATSMATWSQSMKSMTYWNLATRKALNSSEFEKVVTRCTLSPDGKTALTIAGDVFFGFVGPERPKARFRHDRAFGPGGDDLPPIGAVFTATGNKALTWHWDGFAYLWNLSGSQPIRAFQQDVIGIDAIQIQAAISKDESLVLTWSPTYSSTPTRLWDVETGQILREFDAKGGTFSPDGKYLAVFEKQGMRLFDLHRDISDPMLQAQKAADALVDFEVRSGTEVTDAGKLRVIDYDEWLRRRKARK